MATTTNYGWTTPDDTALVKDGASAIRTLGSSVDTTTKNLNPETTLGDLSFRSSTSNVNTRIPIGSSGQHLTVVAGVPAWSTASDQTPLTTKGDLFTFSTVDARLGVGTNTHVLTADSAEATGLKWAAPASGSGMTLLSTTTLSGASTTVSVAAGYVNLFVVVFGMTNATASRELTLRTQQTGGTSYAYNGLRTVAGTTSAVGGGPEGQWNIAMNDYLLRTNADNVFTINIYDYANTSHFKTIDWVGSFIDSGGTNRTRVFGSAAVNDNAAISSLVFANPGGTFSTGTVLLYGVK